MKKKIKVSLIASAVRYQLFKEFLDSLKNTTEEYEVIFVGNAWADNLKQAIEDIDITKWDDCYTSEKYKEFKYIPTLNIKPAQCYEIARRAALGETIIWVADDCEFINDVVGKAYRYWKLQDNNKLILSIQTREHYPWDSSDGFCDMKLHSFYGNRPETPRMAPLALMSREYLNELGGLDRRYICGQYENDIVMRAYQDGGSVHPFGDRETYVDIDHIGKIRKIEGRDVTYSEFLARPFGTSYIHDRRVLEQSWCGGSGIQKVLRNQTDNFEPYQEKNITLKSQSFKGQWE